MSAARLLVDEEGASEPPRGKDPVGQARINLIGTLCLEEGIESLQYQMLEGPCRTGEVLGYLNSLAEEAHREGRRVVVVLDNAPFHKARAIQEAREGWEAKGLELYHLPAYSART